MKNNVLFIDQFEKDIPSGKAVGQPAVNGIVRGGVDVEGVIGVDNDALRIQPLIQPGWGRAGITYGPFKRENGLAFGVHILNGHNTAQSGHLLQGIPQRLKRWMLGSNTDSPISNLLKMAIKGDKRRQWKQLRRWVKANQDHNGAEAKGLDENLAIGWFNDEVPSNPAERSNAFIIHATGAENGELWANLGCKTLRIVRGLQNIPFYYLVILREAGAAYYAASLPGANGSGAYPNMRPLAIEPFEATDKLYAGAWQSVMGQIGFWSDTRIYGAGVVRLAEYDQWYGTAETADRLRGSGDLNLSAAEIGGNWRVVQGRITRTPDGIRSETEESTAVISTTAQPGLVHLLLRSDMDRGGSAVGLLWRGQDEENYWRITVSHNGCYLYFCQDGDFQEIAFDPDNKLVENKSHSLQLADNGSEFSIYLDGALLFERWFTDDRLAGQGQVGLSFSGLPFRSCIESIEVHPAVLPVPKSLNFGSPWIPRPSSEPVFRDDFSGDTAEISHRQIGRDGQSWMRTVGSGRFLLNGEGQLQVDATVNKPNPDRTAYTIPWHEPDFADVRVRISPPGEGRGEWQRGRGGIIFMQDEDNYLIINTWLDDFYEGASISSFFYLDGYEDVYDAVWTNVGKRIVWGRPYDLRVSCDGTNYLVHIGDEPVLYRALTDVYPDCQRLQITRVGLVANWEWGHDTGTRFENFQVFGQDG